MNSEYKSGNSVAQIFVALVATVLIGVGRHRRHRRPGHCRPCRDPHDRLSFLASICVPSKE